MIKFRRVLLQGWQQALLPPIVQSLISRILINGVPPVKALDNSRVSILIRTPQGEIRIAIDRTEKNESTKKNQKDSKGQKIDRRKLFQDL